MGSPSRRRRPGGCGGRAAASWPVLLLFDERLPSTVAPCPNAAPHADMPSRALTATARRSGDDMPRPLPAHPIRTPWPVARRRPVFSSLPPSHFSNAPRPRCQAHVFPSPNQRYPIICQASHRHHPLCPKTDPQIRWWVAHIPCLSRSFTAQHSQQIPSTRPRASRYRNRLFHFSLDSSLRLFVITQPQLDTQPAHSLLFYTQVATCTLALPPLISHNSTTCFYRLRFPCQATLLPSLPCRVSLVIPLPVHCPYRIPLAPLALLLRLRPILLSRQLIHLLAASDHLRLSTTPTLTRLLRHLRSA